jgi:predicted  nucleic acid-binding Zn-ribbon protein
LKKQLELLYRLQSIDSNIKRSETLQKKFEEEVEKLQAELDDEARKSAEVKAEVDELVKKHREHEAALKVLEDQKSKVQEKMMAIKTNKEYSAAQQEVVSKSCPLSRQSERRKKR